MTHAYGRSHVTTIAIDALLFAFVLTLTTSNALAQDTQSDTPLSTAEIARRVTPSVVTITTSTGHGSGVIVDRSGIVVTNLHVIQGETNIAVELSNGDIYDHLEVVSYDERRDLVVLKIRAFNVAPTTLGDSDDVQVGHEVVLVGSPEGFDSTVSEGVISAVRDTGVGYRMLQTTAPASPGSSGGGMFNTYGQLIGIVTLQHRDGQNLNFALPINYVRGLLSNDSTMTLDELQTRVESANTVNSSTTDPASSRDDLGPEQKFIDIVSRLAMDDGMRELIEFEEADDGVWIVTYKGGDHRDEIFLGMQLIQDEFEESIVWIRGGYFTPDADLTDSQLRELLELNYQLNLAKVTLDDDGAILTMGEVELRTLDQRGLIRSVYAVADAADTVAERLFAAPSDADNRSTPSPAPASNDIAGRWTGSGTTSTAVWQDGGCVGESFRTADISIHDIMIWHLNQSGPQITGSIAFSRQIGTSEPFTYNAGFSGTIVGSELRGTVGSGHTETFDIPECGSESWDMEWEPMVFSGTVTGSGIDLAVSERGVVRNSTDSYNIGSSWRVTLQK